MTQTQVKKQQHGLRELTPILREVLLRVKCYQTALPATEIIHQRVKSNVANFIVVLF